MPGKVCTALQLEMMFMQPSFSEATVDIYFSPFPLLFISCFALA
jgi:hypothetical protein